MSTSATMAIITTSQASAAAASAHAARVSECKMVVNLFDSKTATIQESQNFADCIKILHPKPMSEDAVIVGKVFFVLALIGMCIGILRSLRDGLDGMIDHFAYAFFGFLILPIVVGSILLLIAGVLWLFGVPL